MAQVMFRPIAMFAALLIATSAIIAADPATQPTTQPIKLKHFDNNTFNFHLDYPDDWTVLEHPVNNQVFSMQTQAPDKADQNLGVMGLRIDTGPANANDDQLLKQISGQMVDYLFNHGGKNIAIKPDKLGDIPARRISVDTTTSTGTTKAIYIIAVQHHTEYVFNIAAPADQMEKMLPKAEEVVRSFKAEP
jgi:hypothetical protein